MNPATEVNNLWNQALEHIDWDEKNGDHVLELGVETRMTLQKMNPFWWDSNCRYDVDKACWWFRGCFLVKVIHEPLPEASYIGDDTIEVKLVPEWHHMAIHVQRSNGRYRYHDWDGNDPRMM